jgi:hypothetical protein
VWHDDCFSQGSNPRVQHPYIAKEPSPMRLPAYLLGLLSVSPVTALLLTGCGAEADPSPEAVEEPAALSSQSEERNTPPLASADAGSAPVVAPQVNEIGAAPDAGAAQIPNLEPPTNDPCPGCGLG